MRRVVRLQRLAGQMKCVCVCMVLIVSAEATWLPAVGQAPELREFRDTIPPHDSLPYDVLSGDSGKSVAYGQFVRPQLLLQLNPDRVPTSVDDKMLFRCDMCGRNAAYAFFLNEEWFRIGSQGQGVRTADGKETTEFTLSVPDDGDIELLAVVPYGQTIIFVWEDSFFDGGASAIAAVDAQNMRLLWPVERSGFNLTRPVREGRFLYTANTWSLGKIDLVNGQHTWLIDDVYERFGIAYYRTPVINDSTVTFPLPFRHYVIVNDMPRAYTRLVLDKETGAVLYPQR